MKEVLLQNVRKMNVPPVEIFLDDDYEKSTMRTGKLFDVIERRGLNPTHLKCYIYLEIKRCIKDDCANVEFNAGILRTRIRHLEN